MWYLTQQELLERNSIFSPLSAFYPLIVAPKIFYNRLYTNEFLRILLNLCQYGTNPATYENQDFQKIFRPLCREYNEVEREQYQKQQYLLYQQQMLYQQQKQIQTNYYVPSGYGNQGQWSQPQNTYHQGNQNYQNNYNTVGGYPQQNYSNQQQINQNQQQLYQQGYPNQQHSHHQQNEHHKKNKSYVEKPPSSHEKNENTGPYIPPPPKKTEKIEQEQTIKGYIPKQPIVQEETKPQEEQLPVQEPSNPKPPRPSKFTIDQIKSFIDNFSKETKTVNPTIVKEVDTINSWQSKVETITLKEEPRRQYKNRNNKKTDKPFNTGGTYKPQVDIAMGSMKTQPAVALTLGNNESLQTKIEKKKLKDLAQVNFSEKILQQHKNAGQVEKAKRQIVYNLNLLAPENLKDIEGDLKTYLYENKEICKVLIEQIIQKAWVQPKYSSTYAKLCYNFAKKDVNRFSFGQTEQGNQPAQKDEKQKKKANPFKSLLIHQVQNTFITKEQDKVFENKAEEQSYLKTKKKKILGDVKFIAQLIKIKVLNKKIAKICIAELIYDFLANYSWYKKNPKFKYSFYDYYMEAVIEFIQILGEKFQEIDDLKNAGGDYSKILEYINSLISGEKEPDSQGSFLQQLSKAKADDYFKLLIEIDGKILSKTNNRLSSLLKNLEERRDKKWQRHHAQSEGPKKLQDLQNQIAKQEQEISTLNEKKSKKELEKLDEQIKSLLTNAQEGEAYRKQYQSIVNSNDFEDVIMSYLKQVAQAKKDEVAKRLQVFDYMLEKKDVNIETLKKKWPKAITTLAFMASDLPFCGAAMAKILIKIDEKRGLRLSDFYIKFDEDEEQDEKYFMDEVFNKWYFYSPKEEIKEFVEVNPHCSGMI